MTVLQLHTLAIMKSFFFCLPGITSALLKYLQLVLSFPQSRHNGEMAK